jgi:hypothetical protein
MENNLENLKDIIIEFVPKSKIRNDGVGDYFTQLDRLIIRAVKLPDIRYSILIALHELLEFVLISNDNIKESDVDKFDAEVEAGDGDKSDPGNLSDAPYRKHHRFSENMERLLAHELDINWNEYDRVVTNL